MGGLPHTKVLRRAEYGASDLVEAVVRRSLSEKGADLALASQDGDASLARWDGPWVPDTERQHVKDLGIRLNPLRHLLYAAYSAILLREGQSDFFTNEIDVTGGRGRAGGSQRRGEASTK